MAKRVAKKKTTKKATPTKYVGIVLDSSGSMGSMKTSAFTGFNETLDVLRKDEKAKGKLKVWSVLFADRVSYVAEGVAPSTLVDLTDKTYVPNGCTALHDAIAQTILKMEAEAKGDKNAVFLLTVLTDGQENASSDYRGEEGLKKLKELVDRVQKTGRWTINYIGVDGIEKFAQDTGVSAGNTMSYQPTSKGLAAASTTRSCSTQVYMAAVNAGAALSTQNFVAPDPNALKVSPPKTPKTKAKTS